MALPTPTPPGFCDATVTFDIPNPTLGGTISFNITAPALLIGDPFVVGAVTDATLQASLVLNPAYISFVAMGGSINIVSVSAPVMGVSTVVAVIRKPISLPQTFGEGHFADLSPEFVSFICVPARKKRKKILAGILPYIDVAVSIGMNFPESVNFNGNIFTNPVLMATNFNSSKSNASRIGQIYFLTPIEGKADLINDIYRYTNVNLLPQSHSARRPWGTLIHSK